MEPEDVSISWCLVMSAADDLIDRCRVPEGKKVRLEDYDPDWAGDLEVPKNQRKRDAEQSLTQDVSELTEAQERLYAADSWSILMIFEAMDAAAADLFEHSFWDDYMKAHEEALSATSTKWALAGKSRATGRVAVHRQL